MCICLYRFVIFLSLSLSLSLPFCLYLLYTFRMLYEYQQTTRLPKRPTASGLRPAGFALAQGSNYLIIIQSPIS